MRRRRRSRSTRSAGDSPGDDEASPLDDQRPVPLTTLWTTLAVAMAGCGLTGGKEPWTLGVVSLLIALNVAICSKRTKISGSILWPLVLVALLALGCFLPLPESATPAWRTALEQDFGISLGALRTPQPWVSLESWIVLMIGLIWLWHCMGRGFNEPERRWLVRMLALLVAVIAGLAVWFKQAGIEVPFWQRSEWKLAYFGPFPNRNHFGGLLAMGGVLTFATCYDCYRRRSPWWLVYSLALIPIIWALVGNTSRAGLGLFIIGLVTWMIFASFSHRSARRMSLSVVVLLIFVTITLVFGQHILNRMSLSGDQASLLSNSRFQIWEDCLGMIAETPLLGVSLGGFDAVSQFHQSFFDTVARIIHPESDWLWFTSEVGVPAVLLLALALVNFVVRSRICRIGSGQEGSKDRRLRNACAVAALILPLHGLVDTPGHQIGMISIAALLAGLSVRGASPASASSAPQLVLTRLVPSMFCALAGAAWLAVAAGIPLLPGTSSARMLQREAQRLISSGDLAGAQPAMDRAISMTPLDWSAYFDRGALSLMRGLSPQVALKDFARARYLEAHSRVICLEEARLWLLHHPEYAPAAWREGMRRDSAFADFLYGVYAVNALKEHPEIRSAVRSLAITPRQKLSYLGSCDKSNFAGALADILEIQPTLETFSPYERLELFQAWFTVGDRKQLVARLEQDTNFLTDGWPVLAQERADRGDFQGACQLALKYLTPPAGSGGSSKDDVALLRREFLFHPTDFNYGFVLFEAEKNKGLTNDALVTLDKLSQIPNAPARVLYEQAALLARKGDHGAAWNKMWSYLIQWRISLRETPAAVNGSTARAFKSDAERVLKMSPGS